MGSTYIKKVKGHHYFYLQHYNEGKKEQRCLGPVNDPLLWPEVRRKYIENQDRRRKAFDKKIATSLGLTLKDFYKLVESYQRT